MCFEYDLVRFMINRDLRLLFSPLTQLVRIELERAKWHFNCAQPHYNSTTVKIFCIRLSTLQIVFLATLSSLKKLSRKKIMCWKFCRKFLITQIRSNREFLYVTCWFDKKETLLMSTQSEGTREVQSVTNTNFKSLAEILSLICELIYEGIYVKGFEWPYRVLMTLYISCCYFKNSINILKKFEFFYIMSCERIRRSLMKLTIKFLFDFRPKFNPEAVEIVNFDFKFL